jgi:hypothetical protein
MARQRTQSIRSQSPLVAILQQLVVPAFEERAPDPTEEGPSFELIEPDPETGENPAVRGRLRGDRLVHVQALPVDEVRSLLRINLLAGHFIADASVPALFIGNLLDATPFHVRSDCELGYHGRMTVGCDLVVRNDDAPLVSRRLGELSQLADDFDWFFPLRMPNRLAWQETFGLELDWSELPHHDLAGFLDDGMKVPHSERTPHTLLRLAQGLDRWNEVIQLLREHPEEFPRKEWAPLKCLAFRQLKRWLPAIRAAKEGGIRNGRYPGGKWLSPSYLHALIEGGDDIEALRLLGKPAADEPDFYAWLRGLAFHRAGDCKQAAKAFSGYFSKWPGDVLGAGATNELQPDGE